MTDAIEHGNAPAPADPDGDWDDVVHRISDRIKKKGAGAPTTQSSLDLANELVRLERRALEAEALLLQERDAHSLRDLTYLQYGVATAQRGWLTPDDVITTWPLPRLTQFLRKAA